jgi:hypothetical protein
MKIAEEWLREKNACKDGIRWFLNQKETDPAKIIKQFVKKEEHLDWANWLIVRIMSYKQYVSYAVYAAEQVLHIFEDKFPDDRPRRAIKAAKKCVEDPSEENRKIALDAADAANSAANAAYNAFASSAAYAAHDAVFAARFAAYAAARSDFDAAGADYAADAAGFAFNADADACRKMQIKIFRYGLVLLDGGKG